jgi:hypothetical protein
MGWCLEACTLSLLEQAASKYYFNLRTYSCLDYGLLIAECVDDGC